jgi:hypothetical protein
MPRAVAYRVISHNPFTVLYIHADGRQRAVKYSVPLLPKEIEAEADYVFENQLGMSVRAYDDELVLMEGERILLHLPKV